VSLRRKRLILPRRSTNVPFRVALSLLLCVTPGLSQKTQSEPSSLPKYDFHTEARIKGAVDEVSLLSIGTRKDFTELIITNGDDRVHIFVPQTISRADGDQFKSWKATLREHIPGRRSL
jgi:hypothetical protein